MRAYDNRAGYHWGKIHKVVFHRVTVDGSYSSWCCPLMVCLVDVFVETRVVEESVKGGEEGGGEGSGGKGRVRERGGEMGGEGGGREKKWKR